MAKTLRSTSEVWLPLLKARNSKRMPRVLAIINLCTVLGSPMVYENVVPDSKSANSVSLVRALE